MAKKCTTIVIFIVSICFFSCTRQESTTKKIAVFVPGVVSGSPLYAMLVDGVRQALADQQTHDFADSSPTELVVAEAGTNQAEWASKLTALVAAEEYDLIISSNPSLPDLVAPLTQKFPKQKFLLFDGFLDGNQNVASFYYNQQEQGFLAGYSAALVSQATKPLDVVKKVHIALVAAQNYPVMDEIIFPSFKAGAKAFVPDAQVDFRLVGNWFDASKARDIAYTLYNEGVNVILPIAGGANQGVLSAARDLDFSIIYFDIDGHDLSPRVVASSVLEQKKLVFEQVSAYLKGQLEFGTAQLLGVNDSYVKLAPHNAIFTEKVLATMENSMKSIIPTLKKTTYKNE